MNWNFACSQFTYNIFHKANNKGTDQTARMRRLVCACVVRNPPTTGFLAMRPIWFPFCLCITTQHVSLLRFRVIYCLCFFGTTEKVILSCQLLASCGHLLGKDWFLGSLLCDVFHYFCYFPISQLGQLWYLIVSLLDLCFLSYYLFNEQNNTLCFHDLRCKLC